MHKIVESSSFQDIETRSRIDMQDILAKAYQKSGPVSDQASKAGNSENLKGALT